MNEIETTIESESKREREDCGNTEKSKKRCKKYANVIDHQHHIKHGKLYSGWIDVLPTAPKKVQSN